MKRLLAILFALLFFTSTAHADPIVGRIRVDAIKVDGLVRTKEFVVLRELGFKAGDSISQADLDLAVTRLWNTTIFAQVASEIVKDGDRNTLVLHIEDRWTLNPLFAFGSGGSAVIVRAGLSEDNLVGRFLEADAQYQNFDGFHGGQVILKDPRLFDQRIDLLIQAERLVRPRQGFSDQRTQAIAEIGHLFDQDRLRVGFRITGYLDRFLEPLDSPTYFPQETNSLELQPSFRIGRVDLVRLRYTGASLELRPSLGFTDSDVKKKYVGITAEALGYVMFGERWNLAARIRGADITKVPEHMQIYAGGLDLLRGFPDNYIRTNAMLLANVELRFVAFDSTWIALQPTAFVDAVAARAPTGDPGSALAVGGGLRVLVPKFVGTGLRVDLAVPLHAGLADVKESQARQFGPVTPSASVPSAQLSFGVYQFF